MLFNNFILRRLEFYGEQRKKSRLTLEACDDERLFIIKFFAKKRHRRSCHISSRASIAEGGRANKGARIIRQPFEKKGIEFWDRVTDKSAQGIASRQP
jgi:hypothetical protein